MQLVGTVLIMLVEVWGVIAIWWLSVKYEWQTIDKVLMRCEL